MLPIKHIIQVVTLLYTGLLTFQPNDVERGSDNCGNVSGCGIAKDGIRSLSDFPGTVSP